MSGGDGVGGDVVLSNNGDERRKSESFCSCFLCFLIADLFLL